ncbi:hypothetical protein [Streptomyces sp. NBC_01803]|uniref:hypothetical protein n=1 Tax=Streptomyces sp. NBC_01803 TaxID=2975946 RepID=UPI002DDAA850|nr:hypothetical protein [Streptomyces sp. NBC_01803]WSA45004.1 hypothetical protein OIE51_12740 [Streptomyces sp. NBC_01803]
MTPPDDFDPAAFKATPAALGINTRAYTDAFGRTEILIDRAGMEKLRDVLRETGDDRGASLIQNALDKGGKSL